MPCVVLSAILVIVYGKRKCHKNGCWRIGVHHVVESTDVTCTNQNPTGGVTAEETLLVHEIHQYESTDNI